MLCTLHESMTKLCTLKVDIENATICSQNNKKHIFLIQCSYNGHTHLTSLFPHINFSFITQTQRVKPLSLLFFVSFKFSNPTFEMARPTPTSSHKEHQER